MSGEIGGCDVGHSFRIDSNDLFFFSTTRNYLNITTQTFLRRASSDNTDLGIMLWMLPLVHDTTI